MPRLTTPAGQERPTHAEGGQENEGHQQDAGGGTEGVQRIQLRDATADLVRAADHVAGRDGQRAAHEKCRKRDECEPEPEARERQELGTGLEVRVRERIRGRTVLEDERRGEADDPDCELERCVEPQRIGRAVDALAEGECTDSEPGHETGEDRTNGVRRRAEDEREPAHPETLVDQRDAARRDDEHSKLRGERRHGQRVGAGSLR